ncbi:hypothetical protein RF11_13687 [Thelohanellus kitauei]|uniref:Myb-like domain-containing protein n=1 Tax=Thelohanellus kitauei TaxID=669202 RepID=A0A0C2NAC0_THEKT|nr:hypothetical protein RF11_13687 [Thelohanellus kitauei]
MELVDAICEKYQLTANDIDQILINFKIYVLEFKVDDVRDFLTFRKTTHKEKIKETHLKKKLRAGIDNPVKNPVKLLSRLLSDDYLYRKFLKAVRKSHKKIKPIVYAGIRSRVPNWTSEELNQLRININKVCQCAFSLIMELVDAICEKYQLTANDIDQILINFKIYVLEFKVDDVRDFLTFRKTTHKEKIKETHLKKKLRAGIDNPVKNPVKLLSRLLSDDYLYRKFLKAVRKSHKKIKPIVYAGIRSRVPNWTSEELNQLRININKVCQTYGINDWRQFVLDTSPHNTAFRKNVKFYTQIAEGLPGRSSHQVRRRCIVDADKIYNQKWSEESIEELKLLVAQHGRNWVLIGKTLNKPPNNCKYKFSKINVQPGFESMMMIFRRNDGQVGKIRMQKITKGCQKVHECAEKNISL